MKCLSGNEIAVVTDQEQICGGDLLHCPLTPQGNADGALHVRAVPFRIIPPGVDDARRDQVDPDIVRRRSPTAKAEMVELAAAGVSVHFTGLSIRRVAGWIPL